MSLLCALEFYNTLYLLIEGNDISLYFFGRLPEFFLELRDGSLSFHAFDEQVLVLGLPLVYFMLQILVDVEVDCPLVPLGVDLLLEFAIFGNEYVENVGLVLGVGFLPPPVLEQPHDFVLLLVDCLAGADDLVLDAPQQLLQFVLPINTWVHSGSAMPRISTPMPHSAHLLWRPSTGPVFLFGMPIGIIVGWVSGWAASFFYLLLMINVIKDGLIY